MDLTKFFAKSPLIPAIIQEKRTNEVLMLAYMNEESLKKTLESGYTWFFSRSRNELWNKGATSGHFQKVVSITSDCDDDTLLILVEQTGPACHTGNHSCFYETGDIVKFDDTVPDKAENGEKALKTDDEALSDLYQVVLDRKATFTEGSYTCYLFEKGLDKILKKCGEECSEVLIAAKNLSSAADEARAKEAREDVKNEICDLLYHLTVLMAEQNIPLDDINQILKERSRKIGNLKKFHETDHSS
ncbi:bifunctional phosphoribosyl-AMP cyclohydrolase/phosphoribosyl-ATP diphosphatase HisIE [Sinanaerobacter chloroacetimidivorans]|uniref:Histidine biosynthesis bifunctional protein HisIE n=1 Tax=Sinanaerobacter chloroacetimidivorans TaxID=2818044 RepID=A0A8J7W283_9FIRM|nr:bifunctional phosphoribosyl-AMP cyclohydrolase/phosphoribosyl-ATP diphosphatase HisIE [Sinanaerobacter chloroacetimidivorans]MBR0599089.1 bifunctional phosphoribosyl-AMP cyclohydrolase/phosphoribosyl-ATP diphosphatase HisIE [Sinanaerobacter chloroacetimidivorans]